MEQTEVLITALPVELSGSQKQRKNKIEFDNKRVSRFTDIFFLKRRNLLIKYDFRDILYIEADGDYSIWHLTSKKIFIKRNLTKIEKFLPPGRFIRIHRTFLISKQHITAVGDNFIELGEKKFNITRSFKKVFTEFVALLVK